jgi:hypothetical protein
MVGAIMLKWSWTSLISFTAAAAAAFVLVLLGAPKPMAGLIILAYLAYRANNRPVSNVPPADRDQLLAQGPPANHGLVYVHRRIGVGGLVVGFNVKLDHADVALLKVARFTRLVVAPGRHQLVVGPKKLFGQFARVAEKQTAEGSFAIAGGETAVFELRFPKGKITMRKLELDRELDIPTALAKLAQVKMVASEQPAELTQATASMQAHPGA